MKTVKRVRGRSAEEIRWRILLCLVTSFGTQQEIKMVRQAGIASYGLDFGSGLNKTESTLPTEEGRE